MLTSLTMRNFKAFEYEKLEFGSLNILAGLNSSGKSSVIQALRIIDKRKKLTGLGSLLEYIRNDSSEFNIECVRRCETGDEKSWLAYTRKLELLTRDHMHISDIVSYISADRWGPKMTLPLNIGEDIQTVGPCGEYVVDFIYRFEELRVPEALAHDGFGMPRNIQKWLRTISPGVEFFYERDILNDIGITRFNNRRPIHVGFGLSYTLPVIASVLVHSAQVQSSDFKDVKSALLMVENPEAHLHPSGQTMMGRMLALAASCGLQVVVETHSDHLLNGVRLAVKEGKLPCNDVKVYFFNVNDESASASKMSGESAPASVEQLNIDKYGMLDYWPDGFFDETEKNLMQLI